MSLQASEPEAPTTNYFLGALSALRRQRGKIRLPDDHRDDCLTADLASSSLGLGLKNYRERFEGLLLRILEQHNLENEDIELLPPEKAQLLHDNLEELCVRLSEVANDDLQCSITGENTPPHTLPEVLTKYLRLEKMLSRAEQSKGPLELASGSTKSLFKLDTIDVARSAHSVVKKFAGTLDSLHDKYANTPPRRRHHAPISRESRKRQTETYPWLQTFDRSYRAYLGPILDTIHDNFSKCAGSDAADKPRHKILLRLLDIESLNQPLSRLEPDLLLYCHNCRGWQRTECRVHGLVMRLFLTFLMYRC
jgi:hypothetical protein